MAFPTDDIWLGPRAYGLRKGTEGAILHTTEGAGPTRQNAVDTAVDQSLGGSLYAGGGSYHFIIYDGGVLLTVPYRESAGSLTRERTNPPWAPKDWLFTMLSPAAMADPNAYLVAICFSGKAAELAAGNYPENMIDTAARLILWIERESWGPDNLPVMAHSDFQSNRSDPGLGVVDRVLARYAELVAPPPVVEPVFDYKAAYEAEQQRTARLLEVIAAKNQHFDEAGLQIRQFLSEFNAVLNRNIVEIRQPLKTGRNVVE